MGNYLYEIYKFVALKKFSLEFNKRVAPNKAMLEGKFLSKLISVQHVYQEHQSTLLSFKSVVEILFKIFSAYCVDPCVIPYPESYYRWIVSDVWNLLDAHFLMIP